MSMQRRAAVLHAPHDLRIESVPTPVLRSDEVLVRVEAVGVCGSDTHYYQSGGLGRFVLSTPMIVGHEAAGVLVELGSEVQNLSVGDRVAIEPGQPCGRCELCRSGAYNLCEEMRFMATPPVDGAIAEVVAVHSDFAHRIPASMSFEEAAMLEPLSVGIWAVRMASVRPGDRVLVTGAGPVGLLAAAAARAAGATTVTLTDVSEFRLAWAAERGYQTHNVTAGAVEGDFDVLLECSGQPSAFSSGLHSLAPRGRAIVIGVPPGDDLAVPIRPLRYKELMISAVFRYANTWPDAIRLVESGQIVVRDLVTHRFGLSDTEAALTAPARDPSVIKAVVLPNQ